MTFHNSALATLVPEGNYRAADLAHIEAALSEHRTLTFVRLPSGLYSASSAGESIASTGYANVWVRDNIYVAFAHHAIGASHVATEVVRALRRLSPNVAVRRSKKSFQASARSLRAARTVATTLRSCFCSFRWT